MSQPESRRRVITGELPDGTGVFTHVEAMDPLFPGGDMLRYVAWDWDKTPTLPVHVTEPYKVATGLPERQPGRIQVETWVLPPRFPLAGGHESSLKMHSYDTIDIVFVIEGELDLEQSDGTVVRLRRGDVVVQNGTAHAWNNPTDERCVLGFVFCGADRERAAD